MWRFLFLFISFPSFFSALFNLYVQSNISSSTSDGLTPLNAFQNLSIAMSILQINAGIIFLLPSIQEYPIMDSWVVNQSLTIKSYDNKSTPIIVLKNNFSLVIQGNVTLQNVKITQQSQVTIGDLFYLNPGSSLSLSEVEISNISSNQSWNRFFRGGGCFITITECKIINNDLSSLGCFLEISDSSLLIINNSLFSNTILQKQAFFKIWDPLTKFYFSNCLVRDLNLNNDDLENNFASFVLTNAENQYYNLTFSNIALNKGALIRFVFNANYLINIFNISQSIFVNLTTNYRALFFDLTQVAVELHMLEIYFFNNTNNLVHGCLIYLSIGDNSTVEISKTILKQNFAIFIDSYYIKSFKFDTIYVRSHNIGSSKNSILNSYYLCYIESTINISFNKFIISGAYSNMDVGGVKIHINKDLLFRKNDIITRLYSGVTFFLNFTNCSFRNIVSFNTFWMDKGSGMAFHTDIPIVSYIINSHFLENANDLGATCMEAYGQLGLELNFINCVFFSNSGNIGSSCLSLHILKVSFNQSFFGFNRVSMVQNKGNLTAFPEGTQGGALASETNYTIIENCLFVNNSASQGGCLSFTQEYIGMIFIDIKNCTFQDNTALLGGTISTAKIYFYFSLVMDTNYFINNLALDGGALSLNVLSATAAITIKNNSFKFNNGLKGGVVFLFINNVIKFDSNLFFSNKAWNFNFLNMLSSGGVYYIYEDSYNQIYATNNTYLNNTSYSSGGVYSCNHGFIIEIQSIFRGNMAGDRAGSIFLRNNAIAKISYCIFESEMSQIWGGSIYLSENALLYIDSSYFTNCQANEGGIMYLLSHYDISVINTIFENSDASKGSVFVVSTSANSVNFDNCTFFNNLGAENLAYVASDSGDLKMSHMTVIENQCAFISIVDSVLYLIDSFFRENNCTKGAIGCIISAENSIIITSMVKVDNTQISIDGTLFYVVKVNANFDKNIVNTIYGISIGSLMLAISSSIILKDNLFYSLGFGGLFLESSYGNLTNNTFDNKNNFVNEIFLTKDFSAFGSFIYLQNSFSINITFCFFSNNYIDFMTSGGGIKAVNLNPNYLILINNSFFSNNFANTQGGALYFENQKFMVLNSIFLNNTSQFGGAIYFFSPSFSQNDNYKEIVIEGNSFLQNKAKTTGGAIYVAKLNTHFDVQFNINNEFEGNQAFDGAGDNLGSPSFRFKIKNYLPINKNHFQSLIPGISSLNFSLGIVDFYQHEVNFLNFPSYCSLSFKNLKGFSDSNSTFFDGISTVNVVNGVCDFKNVKVQAVLGSKIYLAVTYNDWQNQIPTDSISFYNNQLNKNFEKISDSTYYLFFSIIIPNHCGPGQYYDKKRLICIFCPDNLYKDFERDTCVECPLGGLCQNGLVYNNLGYWITLSFQTTLKIYKCLPYEFSCLSSNNSMLTQCEEGYFGPLCQSCSQGYAKYGGSKCNQCTTNNATYVLLFFEYLAYFLILIIYLSFNYKNSKKLKSKKYAAQKLLFSAYFKIFLNYSQIISIISYLNLDWGKQFTELFSGYRISSGNMHQVTSFECLFEDLELVFYLKIGSVLFMPVVVCIFLMTFWLFAIKFYKLSFRQAFRNFLQSFIITLNFLLWSIIKSLFDFINCVQIYDKPYNSFYLIVRCTDNDNYEFWKKIFILPSLVFFCFLLPVTVFIYMYRNRENLFDFDLLTRISFLLKGYNKQSYYWELLYFIQKLALISIISFVEIGNNEENYSTNKVILCILLCIFSFYGQFRTEPFISESLNKLNLVANVIMILTLLFSLFTVLCDNAIMNLGFLILLIWFNLRLIFYILKNRFFLKQFFVRKSIFKRCLDRYFRKYCLDDIRDLQNNINLVQGSLKYTGKDLNNKNEENLRSPRTKIELPQTSFSPLNDPNEFSIIKIKKLEFANNSYTSRILKNGNVEGDQDILLLKVELSSIQEENNKLHDIIKSYEKKIEDLQSQILDLKILNKVCLKENNILNCHLAKYENNSGFSKTQPFSSEEKENEEIHVKDLNSSSPKTFSGYFGKKTNNKKNDSLQKLNSQQWNSKNNVFEIDFQNLQLTLLKKERPVLDSNGIKIVEQNIVNKTPHSLFIKFYSIECSENLMILKKSNDNFGQNDHFVLEPEQKIILPTIYLKKLTSFQQNDIYHLSIKLSYKDDDEKISCINADFNILTEMKNDWFVYKKILKSEDFDSSEFLKFKRVLTMKDEKCNYVDSRDYVSEDLQNFMIIDFFKGKKIKILIKSDQIDGKTFRSAFINENKIVELGNENCLNIVKKYLKL